MPSFSCGRSVFLRSEGTEITYKIIVGKPEGKRPRRRREDNIKIYLKFGVMMWTLFIWLL
jgi:hypothetical protein